MARTAGTANGADFPSNQTADNAVAAMYGTCPRRSYCLFYVPRVIRDGGRGVHWDLLPSTGILLVDPIIDGKRYKTLRSKIGRNRTNIRPVTTHEPSAKDNQHRSVLSLSWRQINVPFEPEIMLRPVRYNGECFRGGGCGHRNRALCKCGRGGGSQKSGDQ